ncbi:glycine cleavage system aminomethyltransferase GcvT [Variovorax sp. PCZ-1]|uniref:glycine cleavage system aminomethyltransferase GcvT n=1 Tax=Variovorax sp. PCZ-1 TaxID=2835533 RepID=UPI001BCB836E|nr:glycine cleavage system aminomethyltransferase GcvT [Variovorax sp. PCZ-1]MBS7807023.1 glycine cleavage system aminomethyltransferase GcvT [Variovorax sp. PCZ-1]
MSDAHQDLLQVPLNALHIELGARMVPFAGYSMPVQYPAGLMAEHAHTRTAAGLFDVSHMGQVRLDAPTHEARALALESLIPMDVLGLGEGKQRYGLLTNDAGGIIDDLMFTNRGDHIFIIVNGACKHGDLAWMRKKLGSSHPAAKLTYLENDALLALQGPQAVTALSRMIPGVEKLVFMTGGDFVWQGVSLFITRSGYTGEDGFEISVPGNQAEKLARAMLAEPEVKPIGLGARNSLRLEAGLCLYGNDIDTTTDPIEATLLWSIQKARRAGGERAGGFPGATKLIAYGAMNTPATELKPSKKRIGLIAQERIPVRDGTDLFSVDGQPIGKVTSGLLGPTINQPIAMGYVNLEFTAPDTVVHAMVRGKPVPMKVSAMPFVPQRYYRG